MLEKNNQLQLNKQITTKKSAFFYGLFGVPPEIFYIKSFTDFVFTLSPLILIHATLPKDLTNARIAGITKLKQNINDVTIVSMEDTNHLVHWDDPKVVAKEIHNWVNKN
ncbi:hypothetical protein K0H71_22180 [Bacillus sp. IITD106]|nr:hypothetical protein [Bacillus sp. IITD106]